MAAITIGNAQYSPAVHPRETFSVHVKREWGDTWIRVPYLIGENFQETAFPNIGQARVRWEYGKYVNLWYHAGGTLLPVNLENWLIKIVVHSVFGNYIGFIGAVIGERMREEGLNSETGLPTGFQVLECHDISVLLKRRRVLGTYVGDGESWVYLKRTRGVNTSVSHREGRIENRSLNFHDEAGTYMYEAGGVPWSNGHFAQYLLAVFQPWFPLGSTVGGAVELTPLWRLSGQTDALKQLFGEFRFWGKDVFSALDELIDRRRGFGAHIVTDGDGPIYLEVYSLSEFEINGLDASVPANPRQGFVPVGGDHHIQAEYHITEMRAVDEIVVESDEPIKVMATWGFDDGSLEEGFDAETTAAYQTTSDEIRATDRFRNVYSKYQVPKDFDFSPWIPAVDDFGEVHLDAVGAWWHHDMGVERFLPLEEEGATDDAEPQFLEPFALLAKPERLRDLATMLGEAGLAPYDQAGAEANTTPTITEEEFDNISSDGTVITQADINAELASHPFEWFHLERALSLGFPAASMRPGDTGLSVYLEGAETNHAFGLNRFVGASDFEAQWDYKTLLTTQFFRTDEMLRVRLPVWTGTYTDPSGRTVSESNPQGRQIHIVVPGQECWVVAPNTVVGVDTDPANAGGLLLHNAGEENEGEAAILRNDIERIRWTALVAYVWYGTPRATVRLEIANHLPWFRIGDLIKATLSGFWWERVGTVVTAITHDLESGTQTVTTSFGEMDPGAIAEETGGS